MKLVRSLPDRPERVEQEFTLQLGIAGPLSATKGYAAPEVEQTYIRARELCELLGQSNELFPVLRGLWNCYFIRGELRRAYDLAERLAGGPTRRGILCGARSPAAPWVVPCFSSAGLTPRRQLLPGHRP